MAQPFIALGLKGANKLIDKHFDKVPDKVLHPETYHPKNITSKEHRRRTAEKRERKNKRLAAAGVGGAAGAAAEKSRSHSNSKSSDTDDEESAEEEITRRQSVDEVPRGAPRSMFSPPPQNHTATYAPTYAPSSQSTYAGPPIYSQEPPRLRPEYAPSPPPIGSGYPYANGAYAPPPFQPTTIERRGRRDEYGDEDYYSDSYRHPRRPKAVTRRSSSYHGPRVAGRGDQQVARRTSGSEHVDRMKDRAHRYGVKEEVEGFFTKSKEGLAGGAVGALVGGWAAHKAQEAKGREKHSSSPLVTLLGAAIGGLAVNAVIDKYEDGKKDAKEDEKKYDEKWDRNGDRGGDRSNDSDGTRSQRSHRSRGLDDGYGSDNESDGGRSHRSHRSRRQHRERRGSDDYE